MTKFIGNIIRNARKNAKLSQAELSEKLEMSEKNLGNIEMVSSFPKSTIYLELLKN